MNDAENRRIEEEIDRTLRAFDDDTPLQGNPHMAARIRAEMEGRRAARGGRMPLAAGLRYVLILLIVATNVITMVYYFQRRGAESLHQQLVSDLREVFQIDQSQNSF